MRTHIAFQGMLSADWPCSPHQDSRCGSVEVPLLISGLNWTDCYDEKIISLLAKPQRTFSSSSHATKGLLQG